MSDEKKYTYDDALDDLTEAMKGYIDRSFTTVAERLSAVDRRLASFEQGASAAMAGIVKSNPETAAVSDIDDDDDFPIYPAHLTVEERAALFDGIVQRQTRATLAKNPKLAAVPVDFAMMLETVTTIRVSIGWIKDRLDALEAAKAAPLAYRGVWSADEAYKAGSFVSYGGGMWHANRDSKGVRPGEGLAAWTLAVKKGRDGKDATPS